MSLHIQRFVDRVNGSSGTKDFVMPLQDARSLCNELTHLLLQLSEAQEKLLRSSDESDVITVAVSGGSFK